MSKENLTVLTVDDDEHIQELLKYNLEAQGYKVIQTDDGQKALDILNKEECHIVLLDRMLPSLDGMGVLKAIRKNSRLMHLAVIMVTAKTNEIDKVQGLGLGADDYIEKPFGIGELMARLRAVVRRTGIASNKRVDVIKEGDIEILLDSQKIIVRGEAIELPNKEFELLLMLVKNKGRVFDRDYLLEKIWGYDFAGETRTVDVHVRNLRIKIEKDDSNPEHIVTVRGVGYKFV